MSKSRFRHAVFASALLGFGLEATAFAAPTDLLRDYETAARQQSPGFSVSAQRGAQFFRSTHAGEWSCASCHTGNPVVAGQHAKTGKTIAPLSPAANPDRFSDVARVDKWFRRNCNDVLNRACTLQEKGDVLAFLLSLN